MRARETGYGWIIKVWIVRERKAIRDREKERDRWGEASTDRYRYTDRQRKKERERMRSRERGWVEKASERTIVSRMRDRAR